VDRLPGWDAIWALCIPAVSVAMLWILFGTKVLADGARIQIQGQYVTGWFGMQKARLGLGTLEKGLLAGW
jgi:hypothetical protein